MSQEQPPRSASPTLPEPKYDTLAEIEAQRQKMGISGNKKTWTRKDKYGRPLPGGRKTKKNRRVTKKKVRRS